MSKTRDHAAMEKRRKKAASCLPKNVLPLMLLFGLGVARYVAYRWKNACDHGGPEALVSKGAAGPGRQADNGANQQAYRSIAGWPAAHGYKMALWTLPRCCAVHRRPRLGLVTGPGHVWRLPGASGFSCQRPERRAVERDEKGDPPLAADRMVCIKKRPGNKGEPSSLMTKAG